MTNQANTALADILTTGEKTACTWSYTYLDGKPLDAGSITVPGRIDTAEGRKFAALNMIRHDLQFALGCLTDAKKLGLPDSENKALKALIFAGVISYARPFKTSVREFKLTENEFSSLGAHFNTLNPRHLKTSVPSVPRTAHSWSHRSRGGADGSMNSSPIQLRIPKALQTAKDAVCGGST